MPTEIPDRHLRSIRDLGTKLFKTKPFRGVRLYIPPIQNKLILAERNIILSKEENKVSDTENKIFTHKQDAELWKLQRHSKDFTMKIGSPQVVKSELKSKRSIPQIIRSAQENSYSIRNEYVQLIGQMVTGLAATKRFLVLNKRGLDQELLNHVWENVFGIESPLNVDSVMKKIVDLLDTRF